jgi:hypothetical protein
MGVRNILNGGREGKRNRGIFTPWQNAAARI